MATLYSPRIVTDGLVFCIDAANPRSHISGSGLTIYDISGNGRNATLTLGANWSASAFNLPNTASYIGVPTPGNNYFNWTPSGVGFNSFSAEIWIKTTDSVGRILSKPWNGNGEYNYQAQDTTWNLNIGAQSNTINYSSISTGRWEHVVYMASPTQMAVYRNGLLNSGFTNHNIGTNTPGTLNDLTLCVGTLYPYGSWSGNDGFTVLGDFAVVRYYNRVLSASEVQQNYSALRGRFRV